MSNEILKHFGNLVACQINEHPYPFPCPRCGKHSLAFGIFPAVQPKISKRFPIFVCEICAALEADGTVPATEDPLTDWYAAKVFKQSQEVQFSLGNLNAIDFEVTDDGRGVECTFECYFDTEKKFGYRSFGDDGTWVNLYATYFPEDGSLRMCYTISRDTEDINRPYYPTEEEREIIRMVMEKGCYAEDSCSMADFRIRAILQNMDDAAMQDETMGVPIRVYGKTKYCVTVVRTGCVFVSANSEAEARDIANHQTTDMVTWSEDWEATDCHEDASEPDEAYISEKTFE